MSLSAGDLVLLLAVVGCATGLVVLFRAQAAHSLADFLLDGRQVPAWLAGCSISATSLTSGAPLLLTGLLIGPGAIGGWLWWSGALGGLLTAAFFARLWRRTGVITDAEFAELRYGGRPAALLRAFRALYFGLPVTLFIAAWLTRILASALAPALGLPPLAVAVGMLMLAGGWAALGGLRGQLAAHAFECLVALAASTLLAVFMVRNSGGLDAVTAALEGESVHFGTPSTGLTTMIPLSALLTGFAVAWWSAVSFDAEPGGGGAMASRLLAAHDERTSSMAVLWALLLQLVIRPWPMIMAAAVLVVRGTGTTPDGIPLLTIGAPLVPSPWRGLVVAGALVSYLAIVGTALTRGAGYLTHDLAIRFLWPNLPLGSRPGLVRLMILCLAIAAVPVTLLLDAPWAAGRILLSVGAGAGGILLLRWYWWRINAWGELASLGAGVGATLLCDLAGFGRWDGGNGALTLTILVPAVAGTLTGIGISMLTAPEATPALIRFYRRARPGGPGWKSVAKWAGYKEDDVCGGGRGQLVWAIGGAGLLAATAAGGAWLGQRPEFGLVLAGAAVIAGIGVLALLRDEQPWQRSVDLSG
jgi:Na+/proline symporter